jgi:ABC-type branched-subunit amino acid transport system ATPase component
MPNSVLELEHVTKRFGGLVAAKDISFSVEAHEVLFIIGPNGAGKTTLFNLINGFIHPDKGCIRFNGQDITRLSPPQIAKRGIGRTFQIVKPLHNLTILENVMLGAFLHTGSRDKARLEAAEILSFLNMQELAGQKAQGLPLATLKRLEIARALATRPKLILLDEVVAGLPTSEALALASLLKRLPEWGVSVAAGVEHVMQVVMSIADRVIVLDRGKQIAEGRPEEVINMKVVIEAYLGLKSEAIIQRRV